MKFEKDYSIVKSSERRPIKSFIETSVLSALIVFIILKLNGGDMLTLVGPFPWLCLVPVFCALFYGAGYGILSLAILLSFIVFYQPAMISTAQFREYMAGMTCLTFLAAIFSNYWVSRIESIEQLNQYVRKHLEDLSRDYYLLRISHERIEHAYLIKPMSFRDAFFQIKKELESSPYTINQEIAKKFLDILCQYCSADAAAICIYLSDEKELLPMAYLGGSFEVLASDALVEQVIKNKRSTIVGVNTLKADQISEYKLVIPILNDIDDLIGIVVIKELPFWSLNNDTIEVLTVFAAVLGMYWSNIDGVKDLMAEFPNFDSAFLSELKRLIYLKKHNRVSSFVCGLFVPEGPTQSLIVDGMVQSNRSLDSSLIIPMKSGKLILKLLPLTGITGVTGYKHRISNWLDKDFNQVINEQGLNFRYHALGDDSASQQLRAILKEFDYELH